MQKRTNFSLLWTVPKIPMSTEGADSTKKSRKVPKSAEKCRKVPKSAEKCPKVT